MRACTVDRVGVHVVLCDLSQSLYFCDFRSVALLERSEVLHMHTDMVGRCPRAAAHRCCVGHSQRLKQNISSSLS